MSIIFLAYLIEKIFNFKIETLYQKYLIEPFKLTQSQLSRAKPKGVFVQELSDKYDYAAVAIQDHGFFCYSNGFYTTLNELQLILSGIIELPIFQHMIDIKHARVASDTMMNGLCVELRMVGDDLICGYEGLSFSGCNIWSYSTKSKKGYLTFCQDEAVAYQVIYAKFGYSKFDLVPTHSLTFYADFIKSYPTVMEAKEVPIEYQGQYRRVKINEIELTNITMLGNNYLQMRDPDEVRYDLMYRNQGYYIKTKDKTHDAKICLYQAKSANRYMFYNGSLYKQISQVSKDGLECKSKKSL